jgi:hypothetical protein
MTLPQHDSLDIPKSGCAGGFGASRQFGVALALQPCWRMRFDTGGVRPVDLFENGSIQVNHALQPMLRARASDR